MNPSKGPAPSMHQIEDAPAEKRWTIMAAMLGTNMAFALFQGIEQQNNPNSVRLIALVIIVVGLPFQAVWFMIQAFMMEYSDRIEENSMLILQRLRMHQIHFHHILINYVVKLMKEEITKKNFLNLPQP